MESIIKLHSELGAIVFRANGTVEDLGIIAGKRALDLGQAGLERPRPEVGFWRSLWRRLQNEGKIPAAMGLTAFMTHAAVSHLHGYPVHGVSDIPMMLGLLTSSGMNYVATDFASGGVSPRISAFNFHDSGTGKLQASTNLLTSPFASNASPIVITETTHGRTTNDLVTIAGVTTNTAANGDWQILVLTASTYSLYGSTGNGVAAGSPTAQRINGAADTALTTAAGPSRVTGVQTNPTTNQYRSVATIPYTSAQSISEWGLFSASSAGTMLDRRWFNTASAPSTQAVASLTASTVGVTNGDSVQYTWTLTLTAGGS